MIFLVEIPKPITRHSVNLSNSSSDENNRLSSSSTDEIVTTNINVRRIAGKKISALFEVFNLVFRSFKLG